MAKTFTCPYCGQHLYLRVDLVRGKLYLGKRSKKEEEMENPRIWSRVYGS